MAVELIVDLSKDAQNFFWEWDKRNDYASRGSEELIEAALATLHYPRQKIEYEDLVEELADAIIAAVHIAWTTNHISGVEVLNRTIKEKLVKGMRQANAND